MTFKIVNCCKIFEMKIRCCSIFHLFKCLNSSFEHLGKISRNDGSAGISCFLSSHQCPKSCFLTNDSGDGIVISVIEFHLQFPLITSVFLNYA